MKVKWLVTITDVVSGSERYHFLWLQSQSIIRV